MFCLLPIYLIMGGTVFVIRLRAFVVFKVLREHLNQMFTKGPVESASLPSAE